MPNGNVHAAAGAKLLVATGIVTVACATAAPPELAIVGAGISLGAFGGWLVTPDIDLYQAHTWEEQRMLRWLGWLGHLWIAYWWLTYARWHGHRGGGSHTFVLGSLPRFLLLWWPLVLASWWLALPPDLALLLWLGIFVGHVILQDGLHLVMDGLWHQARRIARHH
jgi:uncharacterized metal-binding protein